MKQRRFFPDEIIFAVTSECNLHCAHCFIDRNPHRLKIEDAENFLKTCINSAQKNATDSGGKPLPKIERIGFSGGEPFLYMDFLTAISSLAVENELLFDQIVTNGDWWRDESDLCNKLQTLYDSGYDGKIAVSYDSYHGQSRERMITFISAVQELFGKDAVNIQRVSDNAQAGEVSPSLQPPTAFYATPSSGAQASLLIPATPQDIPVFMMPRTYPSENSLAWQSRHWFKEDYCEGPGHILYIHADGNIAPCCGFANENPALFIGTIKNTFEEVIQNAEKNRMLKICYEEGLSHFRRHGLRKILHSKNKSLPGKTSDICSFCDFVCKLNG